MHCNKTFFFTTKALLLYNLKINIQNQNIYTLRKSNRCECANVHRRVSTLNCISSTFFDCMYFCTIRVLHQQNSPVYPIDYTCTHT